MSFWAKILPARSKALEGVEIFANLDDIITKPLAFVLHGKTHLISPLTTEQFLGWSTALAGLWDLKDKKGLEPDQLIDAYTKAIRSVCKTITKADIEQSTQAQIAAIYGLVLDHCMGRAHTEDYLKKKPTAQPTQSVS